MDILKYCDQITEGILSSIVTRAEIWLYQYNTEDNALSGQWLPNSVKDAFNVKENGLVGKVMSWVFSNAKGILMPYIFGVKTIITSPYYERDN